MHTRRWGDALIAWTPRNDLPLHPDSHSTGRMLARTLVAELTGLDADTIRLESPCPDCGLPHGKPRVVGAAARARVSVSHAGPLTLAIAALDHEVGIDAEQAGASAERLAAIEAVAGASIDPLRHWTRVEAVLKADGRGLRVDPREVSITSDTATLGEHTYALEAIDIEGFVVSVARDAEAIRQQEARTTSR